MSMHHDHVSVPVCPYPFVRFPSSGTFKADFTCRSKRSKRTRGRKSQGFEITTDTVNVRALYHDRRDVAELLSAHPHPPHSMERCFYMCGPSLCSRLVVKKRFETFITFFPPAPSTAENAPKVKQGKMEKRVTTFFFSEV